MIRPITIFAVVIYAALFAIRNGSLAQAAVMSIDYGTEWFKVGLIKPGIPLDVALNKDSKRKTQAVVTIRDNERMYGSDAVALSGRFPHLTFANLKSIAGKPFNDKHCVEYRHRFVNTMLPDPRRNVALFKHGDSYFSVEELIAYQFQNARDQAKHAAGEDVKDVVITVAPFATQYERQAILDAAELAGLNVLALMHDETAVALNYAINREFNGTEENHIFYDMGAGSTVASVVGFSNVDGKEGKVPQLEVKAVGFDRTLGGHEFDVRLQMFLAEKFMEQHGKSVKSDIRDSENAMTRLLKEANRVKQILSANTETMASVEGLHEQLDFRTKVTRAELEALCSDLLARVSGPIESALKASNMSADDIKSLVLVGGSVRIPAVQKVLSDTVGAQKLAKNVNGDEAAVLGAAFRGASLSNQFRLTKQIKIKDVTIFPIQVTYEPESEAERKSVQTITLFNEFGAIGTRKIMTFKRQSDFEFDLTYGKTAEEQDALVGLDKIAKVKITGLTEAMEKYKEKIAAEQQQPPKVRVAIELSSSGLLSVPEATLSIQVPTATGMKSFTDKVKSFFGAKEEGEKDDEQKTTPSADQNTTLPENTTTTKEPGIKKVTLNVEVIPTGPAPMNEEEKVAARQRIKELDQLDEKRRLREEARNNLESFVYRIQDFLYDDTVAIVSTEKQREELSRQLSETSDWLYDEGEQAETSAYIDRLRKLQLLERPITFRRFEYLRRQENIEKIDKTIQLARAFVETLRTPKEEEEERNYTDEELDSLSSRADALEKWKTDTMALQSTRADHEEPALTTAETKKKCQELDDALMKLMRKKNNKPKTKKKTGSNNNETDANNNNNTATEQEQNTEGQEQPEHDEL